jgi:hypothetical protein
MNTAISEKVMEIIVKPISRAPLQGRLIGPHAMLDMADDVFQHDDGVVDHKPTDSVSASSVMLLME